MKKYGGFVPNVRAGKPTERYLTYVINRIQTPGAIYLAVISLMPLLAMVYLGTSQDFPLGGVYVLIIIGVGLETVKQIDAKLQRHHYEGILRSEEHTSELQSRGHRVCRHLMEETNND